MCVYILSGDKRRTTPGVRGEGEIKQSKKSQRTTQNNHDSAPLLFWLVGWLCVFVCLVLCVCVWWWWTLLLCSHCIMGIVDNTQW